MGISDWLSLPFIFLLSVRASLIRKEILYDLIRKETAALAYKTLNSLAPAYMRKLFTKYSDDSEKSLRSTETDLRLPLPMAKRIKLPMAKRLLQNFGTVYQEKQNWHLPLKLSRNEYRGWCNFNFNFMSVIFIVN